MLRRRASLVLAVLALALRARLAAAGTSLWVRSEPDDPVGGGVERAFGSADGSFTGGIGLFTVDTLPAGPGSNRLEDRPAIFINFMPGPGQQGWGLVFIPPTLAPGSYPNAQANDPIAPGGTKLVVSHMVRAGSGPPAVCGLAHGGFTISELVRTASGDLASFAAEFVQVCQTDFGLDRGTLRGAVRFHVGDAACAHAATGTPCDDGNPCTLGDACRAPECVSARASDTCDPATCDDGNVCTADVDEAGLGCRSAVDGSCWALTTGSVLTSITLGGKTCGCRVASAGGVLSLRADGTFRAPGGRLPESLCPSHEGVTLPDEVGEWRRVGRSRRLRLRTTNLAEIAAAVRTCAGRGGRVHGYQTRAVLSADGRGIKVASHFTVSVRGASAPLVVVSRSRGEPGTGEYHGPPSGALADVGATCAERIARCLGG